MQKQNINKRFFFFRQMIFIALKVSFRAFIPLEISLKFFTSQNKTIYTFEFWQLLNEFGKIFYFFSLKTLKTRKCVRKGLGEDRYYSLDR